MNEPGDDSFAGPSMRGALRTGVLAMVPVLIGIVPFAAVAGLAGTHNGLTVIETAAFSLLAFAGAAQVAALDLIGNGAGASVVIATALIINFRFIVYSAALAPMFTDATVRQRAVGAYLLVDHAVPLTLTRTTDWARRDQVAFYTGACLVVWLTWQACSFIGSLFGSLPDMGVIAFAVPVSFLALLAPQLSNRPKLFAAIVAGVVAVAGASLPANLGMVLGTFAGIATGVAFGWRAVGEQAAS